MVSSPGTRGPPASQSSAEDQCRTGGEGSQQIDQLQNAVSAIRRYVQPPLDEVHEPPLLRASVPRNLSGPAIVQSSGIDTPYTLARRSSLEGSTVRTYGQVRLPHWATPSAGTRFCFGIPACDQTYA